MTEDTPVGEQWLPVPEYEGLYEVSNLGRVRSLPRQVAHIAGSVRTVRGVMLKPILRDQYLEVHLSRENRKEDRRVHALVAQAFIGPQLPGMQVRQGVITTPGRPTARGGTS